VRAARALPAYVLAACGANAASARACQQLGSSRPSRDWQFSVCLCVTTCTQLACVTLQKGTPAPFQGAGLLT
jgi:hypothetical protein